MKILCFTGSRAEYYILRPLFIKLSSLKKINLELIISGGITKEETNQTLNDIKKDQIKINNVLDIPNTYATHSEIIGYLCMKLTPYINNFSPDLCIVYADRYESFAFATTATHLNKILLHIEAGDITEGGTYDDYIRHCISKMSHLFCTSTLKGIDVISRLGEESWRSIQSGLVSYDDMAIISEKDKDIVKSQLNINDNLPIIVATMHPIPRDLEKTKIESQEFFCALGKFFNDQNIHIFITSPNSDNGKEIIIQEINKLLKKEKKINYIESLGGHKYQTLMSLANERKVIICGNSSSIIKEAPYFKAHSLNVGIRQNGREFADSQINCEANMDAIYKSLKMIISKEISISFNPYYLPNSSERIVNFIFDSFKKYSREKILNKKWNEFL